MNKNILISTGKTGGHIVPAILVSEEYHRINPKAKIIFAVLGGSNVLEIFPSNEEHIYFIDLKNWKTFNPAVLIFSVIRVYKKIKENNVSNVLIFGSYLSIPVAIASLLAGVNLYLHEQNVLPGRANRFIAIFSKKIFVSYIESSKYFLPHLRKKIICTGNPVRKFSFGEVEEKNQILFLGGSQGAQTLNELIINNLNKIRNHSSVKFILITGKKNYNEVLRKISDNQPENLELIPFTRDILSIMANSKLIVSRAGAATLSEIALTGKPSILVPYPFACDNHQEVNARYFEKKGASFVIKNEEIKDKFDFIMNLFNSSLKLKEMGKASKSLFISDASDKIVKELC